MNEIIFWSGVWSKWYSRPIGVYQLAYWLRKHNVESQIIEFCQWYSAEELLELTIPFITEKTKYIGISTTFWVDEIIPENIQASIEFIKKEFPHIKILLGGPRADNNTHKNVADIILTGEAENKIINLIKGHNINIPFDITTLEHRFSEKDCIIDGEVLPIELGRGCIFKCKFCGHHNLGKTKHTYQRNIRLIEEEICFNYENFKTTYYNFLDDTVNEDLEKIKNLSLIRKNTGVDISWNGYLRADLLHRFPETPYQLYDSGLRSCFFGIESLHPRASLVIGKAWSGKHAKEFLPKLHNNIWDKRINIWANFIVGLPDESLSDIYETVEWCKETRIGSFNFAPLSLYNRRTDSEVISEFNRNYKKYGYEIDQEGCWHSSKMNGFQAFEESQHINKMLLSYNKLSSWQLFDSLNCGLTIDQANTLPQSIITSLKFMFFKRILFPYKEKLKRLH